MDPCRREGPPGPQEVEGEASGRGGPHGLQRGVHRGGELRGVRGQDGHGPERARELEAVLEEVEGIDLRRPHVQGRDHRHQTHRSAADDGHPVPRSHVPQGGEVHPGGHDVAREQGRGVTTVRHPDQGAPGQGDADELGLPTVEPLAALDPAEQLPHLAARAQPSLAGGAGAAARGEVRDDPIPGSDPLHRAPHLEDLAGELVPQHRPAVEAHLGPAVHVQVRAADGRELHAHDGVGGLLDGRVGSVRAGDVLDPLERERSHCFASIR